MQSIIPLTLTPESSQIHGIGYDPLRQVLAIEFNSNHDTLTYEYPGVTPDRFAEFQASESKGSWFYKNKRSLAEFERLYKAADSEGGDPA
jgi:hypothetical protein